MNGRRVKTVDIHAHVAFPEAMVLMGLPFRQPFLAMAPDRIKAMDEQGLVCTSSHVQYERLQHEFDKAVVETKTLGAKYVICPWIPHTGDAFTREDALKAAADFNRIAKAGSDAGLRFGYHCHGYEFVPSTEGTLFDTLAQNSDPKLVGFQIDVFHALNGGADPVALITKHDGRIRSLHIKDMRKGFTPHQGSAGAPPDADVPIGTGQVDWPAVLRAAMKSGATEYYIEDESTDPWGHIPQSVAYLEGLKL